MFCSILEDMQENPQSRKPARRAAAPRRGRYGRNTILNVAHRAADRGDADAQCNLGILYDNGAVSARDSDGGNRAEAIKWLLLAAQQGLPRAQRKLAELYADENEDPRNHVRSCAWFLIATELSSGIHCISAHAGFERVASLLNPAQVTLAKRLARGWRPKGRNGHVTAGSPGIPSNAGMAP